MASNAPLVFLKFNEVWRVYKRQSNTDSCILLGKESIVLVYNDDCTTINRRGSQAVDDIIKSLKEDNENINFTYDGNLEKNIGVEVKHYTYVAVLRLIKHI